MNDIKYFSTYDRQRIGTITSLKESQQAISNHSEFKKSKYTKKGLPRSNFKELKRFYITDNKGDMYYIY